MLRHDYYGNVLFIGEDTTGHLRDLTFQDWRHIVDHISVDTGRHSDNPIVWAERARKIEGVRIHCREDNPIQLEFIQCPQDHPIFQINDTATPHQQFSLCDMIDLPLICQENPPDEQLEQQLEARFVSPSTAAILKWLPPPFNAVSGAPSIDTRKQVDIALFRSDGKELDILHIEVLWEFIEDELLPVNTSNMHSTPRLLDRGHILSVAKKEVFEEYFARIGSDDPALSPYNAV